MMNTIHTTLRRYIVENFLLGDEAGFDNAQSLLRTGVVDSTGILELVSFVEETYGLSIADEEMLPENLDSVDNIAAYVKRKREIGVETAVAETPALTLLRSAGAT